MWIFAIRYGYRMAVCLLCVFFFTMSLRANNVRVRGDVKIDQLAITPQGVATVFFTLEWDNSWRDDFNHDAVYFFLKYMSKDGVWRHMYLEDSGHTVSNGYELILANSTKRLGKNEGFFVRRTTKGSGTSSVVIELKWNMKSNPLEPVEIADFESLSWSGMGIEMVFVPRGPFFAGDNTYSAQSFRLKNLEFPAQYDIAGDGYFTASRVEESRVNPASLAVNKVNDVTNSTTNSWVGNGSTSQWWMIDFYLDQNKKPISGAKKRMIRYIALAGLPGRTPRKWKLEGSDDYTAGGSGAWVDLKAGTGTNLDWDTTLLQVYPPRRIIKVNNPHEYRYYRLNIEDMDPIEQSPVIKSIAMTEKELATDLDYSVLIDAPEQTLGGEFGMFVEDSDTWSGKIGDTYPNGYKGFYVMKYEISQEQYMEFLNKLPYEAQKARTIGDALDDLQEGHYVFGKRGSAEASNRNGIILVDRQEGASVLFGCDLDKTDDGRGLEADGQAIACNYLTVNDMLAYAQWCGLRPLSEMEYEKMCRRPYPVRPEKGEYAWNSSEGAIFAKGLEEAGKKTERVREGNVNARQVLPGPVRCGIFATELPKQSSAGSSFWGVMELSGNLSEMYYAAGSEGRKFKGIDVHGSGELPADGNCNMKASWPDKPEAIAVRGGSFQSTSNTQLATSDRSMVYHYFQTPDDRDSTVTFRLGYSCTTAKLSSILTAENGQTTELGMALDTICSGMDYHIRGDEDLRGSAFYTYLWYTSENGGKSWKLIEGEEGRDLTLRGLTNIGLNEDVMRHYRFKRKIITPYGDGESNVLDIAVINASYTIDRLRDTVTIFDEAEGISVETRHTAEFTWTVVSSGRRLTPTRVEPRSCYLMPTRKAFTEREEKNLFGDKIVELNITIGGVCRHSETIEFSFPDELNTNVIGIIEKSDGTRLWSDGTYARSADEYRNPTRTPKVQEGEGEPIFVYRYVGKTGNGVYWIDPDGPGGIAPFAVYCDMEIDGHGWMLAGKFSNHDAKHWCADKAYWTDTQSWGDYSNGTKFEDAKSPVWSICKANFMMFQTMGVPAKAFVTDTLHRSLYLKSPLTLSDFFTRALNGFPNHSSRNCAATVPIRLVNARYQDFPWIAADGFYAGQIAIGKTDRSDTQGVISGYSCFAGEADCGLGSLEDAVFNTNGSQSDVGYGGSGASSAYNVLLFVR